MDLSNLQYAEGSRQSNNFRRGRGHGSGNGKTAGKGHKGQKARSGAPRPGFEGGQMPLYRRIPKRGFTNRNSKDIVAINLSALERFDNDSVVSIETLIAEGIVKNPRDGVKILGNGELTKKLTVQANAFSAGAAAKIEALGGKAEVI
ncbi:MAG: 50S ribosomal protein L15 [Eubacteriales bacterium]|nr:50S ribosomal protein L15 [Eubacteriales bacterium]